MEKIILQANKLNQKTESEHDIYYTQIKAKDFAQNSLFVIDHYRRKDKSDLGFQRKLDSTHVDKYVRYITEETKNPIAPISVTVNCREKLAFEPLMGSSFLGHLVLDKILHIIDGQHRRAGWQYIFTHLNKDSNFDDFELPIIITSGLSEHREIETFYIINQRQKKIATDLALRHMGLLQTNSLTSGIVPQNAIWQLNALKISDVLNENLNGVWSNAIALPSDSMEERKRKLISQNTFINSMKLLFVGKRGKSKNLPVFRGKRSITDLEKQDINVYAELLSEYWSMVASVWPEAFEKPNEYLITNSVGVYSFHKCLAQKIHNLSDPSPSRYKSVLGSMEREFKKSAASQNGLKFWAKNPSVKMRSSENWAGAFSSNGGHNLIVQAISNGQVPKK